MMRRRGLIPAHAGKTVPGDRCFNCHRAHPRSRGENRSARSAAVSMVGSSPLTRGKRPSGRRGRRAHGLIPAHAGKTRSLSYIAIWCWAHPRSRGENQRPYLVPVSGSGSSPLTRGKHRPLHGDYLLQRLIPAHAGKTRRRGRSSSMTGAHPRSRGENAGRRRASARTRGSSPLTRGKRPVPGLQG